MPAFFDHKQSGASHLFAFAFAFARLLDRSSRPACCNLYLDIEKYWLR
jgi:hypothetical protein